MTSVPEWRRGAIYHRAMTDAQGLVTGREVTVYPTLWGAGRLCEGSLAADVYDHEYWYETVSEAVHAAENWSGHHSPPGKWINYRSKNNGDTIESEESSRPPTAEERAEVVNSLVREKFPEVSRAFKRVGVSAAEFAAQLEKTVAIQKDLAVDQFGPLPLADQGKKLLPDRIQMPEYVTIEEGDQVTTREDIFGGILNVKVERIEGVPPDVREVTYECRLDRNGIHTMDVGSRLRVAEVFSVPIRTHNYVEVTEAIREARKAKE